MTTPRVFSRQQESAGFWRRTPPAIFPPVMGLFGLGLAGRRGAEAVGFGGGLAEMVLGAVTLLWLFGVLAYGAKTARRPGVVMEDLTILPGRAGLSAMVLSLLLFAAVLLPYSPPAARAAFFAGLGLQTGLAGLIALTLIRSAPEGRVVTPVWHLSFVGFIIAGLTATPLGMPGLGEVLLWGMIPVALAIWVISGLQLIRRVPPAPLRPLLAIHLAPASLLGTVSAINGHPMMAAGFALFGLAIFVALILSFRWIIETGFSPLWGAFTFPLAAYAGLLLLLGGGWAVAGMLILVAAAAMIPMIALRVFQLWARGQLAVKTNAAVA